MLSGVIPPTGRSLTGGRSTARQALTTAGGKASAGNILSASAPADRAAKASVGVANAGYTEKPEMIGLADQIEICMRHNDQTPASARDIADVGGL